MTEPELTEMCARFLCAEGQDCIDMRGLFTFDMDPDDPDLKMVHERIGKHLRKQIMIVTGIPEEEIISEGR